MVDFSSCKTSEDTYKLISDIIKSKDLRDVKAYMSTKFYNADSIIEFLYYTFISEGNGILYGPGGFGKSQITKEFLKYYDIPIITKVGHSSMDVEALLGIPNIKKLTEESKYEVAFDNSIFRFPGVLVLEEFLDVRSTVAAALKDIITEGGYRDGDKFIDSLNGPIIICSNKSPDEVTTDLSTAAFYKERFPYSLFVAWDSYTNTDYYNLLTLVDPNKDEFEYEKRLTAEICAVSCRDDIVISPRVAMKALDIIKTTQNIEYFKMISDLNISKIDEIISSVTNSMLYKSLSDDFKELIKEIRTFEFYHLEDIAAFRYFVSDIREFIVSNNFSGEDLLEIISELNDVIDEILAVLNDLEYSIGKSKQSSIKSINKVYENIQVEVSRKRLRKAVT
jgi:hypothetical protein